MFRIRIWASKFGSVIILYGSGSFRHEAKSEETHHSFIHCFLDAAQLRKQVQGVRKNKGGGRKRTANEAELDDDEPANQGARQELVRLEDIEMVYSKRRKDKEAKMEAILKGKIETRSRNFVLQKWAAFFVPILAFR